MILFILNCIVLLRFVFIFFLQEEAGLRLTNKHESE